MQPAQPTTSMVENLFDKRVTTLWNAGYVFGWISSLCENNTAYFFTSIVIREPVTVTEALPTVTLREALRIC